MRPKWKRALTLGLAVLGIGWIGGRAEAFTSTDTMRVSVTPDAQYSVQITSAIPGVGYDFQTVALNSTTQSTVAITLTNNGTIYEYFGISVSNTSGNWTGSITVTAQDNTGGVGVGSVGVSIFDGSNYWNGTSFASSTPVFNRSHELVAIEAQRAVVRGHDHCQLGRHRRGLSLQCRACHRRCRLSSPLATAPAGWRRCSRR